MATIALNYSPIGQMSGFFEQIKTSISNYQSELVTIQTLSSAVDSTIYNLDDVISEVQTSTTLQDDKTAYIGTLDTQMQTFVDNAVSRDQQAAEEINASKDDFYERYEYLKPDIEKSGWENFWEDVGEWCAKNWKAIAVVVLVVIAVALIVVCTVFSGGAFIAAIAPVLLGIAKGILVGALVGGLFGGISGAISGDGFWSGFWDGAFSGAISGAISGGIMGGLGETVKMGIKVLVGGGSEALTALIVNLCDMTFSGKEISLGEMLFDIGLSFALGALFTGAAEKISDFGLNGISSGRGSWSASLKTQLTRAAREGGRNIKLKTILKGLAGSSLEDLWDTLILEPIKIIVNFGTEKGKDAIFEPAN